MAKRIIDWSVMGNELHLNKYNSDKDATVENFKIFNLDKLYPEFEAYNEVQKHIVVYGTKQILADAGASAIGDIADKVQKAVDKWELLIDGKLNAPRANGTDGQENKRILGEVKTLAKVVSLEGLMVKKMTYPDQFTTEDQEKLNELMEIAVQANKKANKN